MKYKRLKVWRLAKILVTL